MTQTELVPHWTTADGELVRLYHGDVLATLRRMPSRSVHAVTTSPPYWGLRDYSVCSCRQARVQHDSSTLVGSQAGTPEHFGAPKSDCPICHGTGFDLSMTVWVGGDNKCAHNCTLPNVGTTLYLGSDGKPGKNCTSWQGAERHAMAGLKNCTICGAHRVNCQLGSERVPDCLGWARGVNCADDHTGGNWLTGCHVCRMVLVFREVRRVLRDDGTCWINYGDTYASGGENRPAASKKVTRTSDTCSDAVTGNDGVYGRLLDRQGNGGTFYIETDTGLAAGNLIGVPWRIALALQADGWILRSDLPWVKRNPMPESAESRPGKALEYVFQFVKEMGAYFDMDAVKAQSKGEWNSHKDMSPEGGKNHQISQSLGKLALTRGYSKADGSRSHHPDIDQNTRNFRNADLWFDSLEEGKREQVVRDVLRLIDAARSEDKPQEKALQNIFQFVKQMHSYFDMDSVKRNASTNPHAPGNKKLDDSRNDHESMDKVWGADGKRNMRSSDLWFESIETPHGIVGVGNDPVGLDVVSYSYEGSHYATFPPKLIEPLIKCSTSEAGCCAHCGTSWKRVVSAASGGAIGAAWLNHDDDTEKGGFKTASSKGYKPGSTIYWEPDCTCHGRDGTPERIPCTVLDPFMGSGTTACVSAQLGRRSVGIEISLRYIEDHQVQRITDTLRDMPSLHDQIVERPRKVYKGRALSLGGKASARVP